MPRVTLVKASGLAVLAALFGAAGAAGAGLQPTADDPATSPEISVHAYPASLVLREDGTVKVKAGPPAAPGDAIYLNTAGTYNAGYNRVSEAVLDKNLSAVLRVPGREFLGTYNYFAALPATATHLEGTSGQFPIEIVKPPAQTSPSCGGAAPRKADGTAWVCTYDDEFEGPELDRRYWVPQETEKSGFTTGTKTTYACALDSPGTIDVRNGNLELSLVDLGETRDCGKNRSSQYAYGQVMHHQTYSQTYGRYEVRARIPDVRTTGSQVSFWLWPETETYGPWPSSGELDFAEMYSSTPGILRPFMHYLPGATERGSTKNVRTAECPIRVGEYNTYGMVWEPGRVTILLNGKVCMVNDYSSVIHGESSAAPFDHPFYLALNQAMGTLGNLYDPDVVADRLTTQVDYVRVWR
jgi:beta-glucanase (GH16 family)